MTSEDDADSFLRALAAAPPVRPPERRVTAMLIRFGDAAPLADQIESARTLVTRHDGNVADQDGTTLTTVWPDAVRAAGAALELRESLPETRIALGSADARQQAIENAAAGLAHADSRVVVDAATADLLESRFELERTGDRIVLVEPLASGTPARVSRVIGNYKIVRLLGTGGMGVVYLAEHVSLGRKAVIKFVQDRLSKDREYSTRFFTEAKTAASIRHPGIVDVFDYGTDENGRGYIVMELLEGESLRTRLRRDKPLAQDVAVALAIQIANAVEAAHAAGVIHRDLKPDNIFLVPDPEAPHKIRAKVLDFGLAKVTAAPATGVTQTGNFIGTPLYMSPEQCRSKAEIDQRTDIYSLGCILYEMVCARPPFVDQTVGDLIIAHSTTPPPAPRSLQPALAPALERIILRALAKQPDERYPTMGEFAGALGDLATASLVGQLATTQGHDIAHAATPVDRARPPRRFPLRRLAIAVLAVSALATAAIVLFASTSRDAARTTQPASARRAIAVIKLENKDQTQELAWLSTALAEIVASDLTVGDHLEVIPAADVARMQVDLGLRDIADIPSDRLAAVRSALGADYVLLGSFSTRGDKLHIEMRLLDTTAGTVTTPPPQDGREADLADLGARVANAVKRELGVAIDEVAPIPNVLPSDPTAAKLYSDGVDKLRYLELIQARDLLTRAASVAPEDPLIHSALVTVWRELGYDGNARTAAKLAYDYRASLPQENQLVIEAQFRETTGQWEQAIALYRTLFELKRSRLDYGLALAAAQTRAGDVKSAYATIERLHKLPEPLGSDPRIELADAAAAEAADDMERVRVSAGKAAKVAKQRGARLLYAKALFRQGWAVWTLGRDADAERIYAEAQQLFLELGDRAGVARTLNNIALAHHRRHRDSEAKRAFTEALALATEIGDTQAQAWVLNNWAYVLADAGELPKALELNQQKLDLGAQRGVSPSSLAAAHVNISEILRWRGDLAAARDHCQTALDLMRGLDTRRFAAHAAYQCGAILHAEDDLDGAKKRLDQATVWASNVLTPAEAAEIRIEMARVELDAGRAANATALARTAAADLRAGHEGSQHVCAIAVHASALLASSQLAEAAKEIALTASLPGEGVSFACRLEAEIAAARITAATDPKRVAEAVAKLESVRERAAKATFVQLDLYARLAIAELKGSGGRALAREARALGFKLVERKAGSTP